MGNIDSSEAYVSAEVSASAVPETDKPGAEEYTSAQDPGTSAPEALPELSSGTEAYTLQTESPEETTRYETSETAAPKITEAAPEITTTAPEITTAFSETTTAAPVTTTTTAAPTTAAAVPVTAAETYRASVFGTNSYSALNFREQKGIWISYLEYGSILQNKSASSFRKSIGKYFDNIRELGFNTVYTQVRAYGDAYYASELFPSGDRFNGTMGTDQSFDALQIMIEEAHDRGLSLHAWINPMRLMTDKQLKALDSGYTVKQWYNDPSKKGKLIVESGGRWYLNPAYDEVVQLIADGITEIVSGYDVDGVQIDDYFYPTTSESFDKAAYNASGTGSSLSRWRINNVNVMVKRLCQAAHGANSSVVFGISPQGSVDNNYNELYADVKTWCADSSYCDYILPQVYFGFENAGLPYADTIKVWSGMVPSSKVKLVIGLAGYKVGASDTYAGASGKNEWINNSDILSRQMSAAKELSNYGGVAIFRYGSIFTPEASVSKQVSKELNNIRKNE